MGKYADADKIPQSAGNVMGRLLFDTIKAYFEDPEHQKEFEAWKKSRDAEEQEGKVTG